MVKTQDRKCREELISYFDIQWKADDTDFHLLSDGVTQKEKENPSADKYNPQLAIYNFLADKK
jgi:hypothetical protein